MSDIGVSGTAEKSEKPDGKKNIIIVAVIAAVIFVGSIIGCLYVLNRDTGQMVEVLQDGEVIYTFDLSTAEDQEIEVLYGDDGRNVILIQDGRICVSEANCPDHICMEQGWLDSAVPITCLPNRLTIRFVDAVEETGLDAVSN